MRRTVVGLVAVAVAALVAGPVAAAPDDGSRRAYIVVLERDAGDPGAVAAEHQISHGGRATYVFRHALRGYVAPMSDRAAMQLADDPRVAYVEPDGPVSIVDVTQAPSTWGLDRIDQRNLPLSNSYSYGATGAGVTAYIIDTGIRVSHTQFGGRAVHGTDTVDADDIADDCNGHGTHVAGTVGGSIHGVAKAVTLVAVRVLNCSGSGTWAGVIAGIDWVTAHHTGSAPAVANMSLGGGGSLAVDDAVRASIADGITYGVAAGNSGKSACNYSPARVGDALTVGATNNTDTRASWSNYGTCLDLFAPGVSITSAWHSSDTATNTISGTSMATPHVAGVAALYLEANPTAAPSSVASAITTNATPNKVTSAGSGSPNLLLHSIFGTGVVATAPAAPSALAATPSSSSTIDLAWTDGSSNETGFEIERRSGTGAYQRIATVAAGTTSYTDSGLAAETTYTYQVRAVNGVGPSSYSNEASATTTASTSPSPISLSGTASKRQGRTTVDLSWSGAAGAIDVFRGGSLVAASVAGSSWSEVLRGGGSWTYQVCPTGTGAGSATCSNSVTLTT